MPSTPSDDSVSETAVIKGATGAGTSLVTMENQYYKSPHLVNMGSGTQINTGDRPTFNIYGALSPSSTLSPQSDSNALEAELEEPPILPNESFKGVSTSLDDKLSRAIQGFMSSGFSRLIPPAPSTSTDSGSNPTK
ncbi:hypothetical protein DFP72DRAFT_1173259 [Ephemerocybe angulata]|uniref:Uncharacterized protein n=1 Tax=Ephemerocybe angulata TaxID=980116 RepID=A0A8H6M1M0_9AGAR|nr:hypothetical protein DFP72DRAFT_1173259 [Tulosesus angulatus]